MCIYLIIDIILYLLFIGSYKKDINYVFVICCMLIFFVMVGHNGIFYGMNDYTPYMNLFLGKNSMYGDLDVKDGYTLELPFYYFNKILRIFPRLSIVYMWGIAITFCVPLFMIIKKESVNPAFSFLLLMLVKRTGVFFYFMTIHRQMLATTFFLWAYYIFEHTNIKYKKYYVLILLLLGLFSHSSSYFVLIIVLIVYFIKLPLSKKTLYTIVLSSLCIGLFIQNTIINNLTILFGMLNNNEEVYRSTHYLVSGDFNDAQSNSLFALLPMAFLVCAFIHSYTEEELNKKSVKCWLVAFIIYLNLATLFLIDRALLLFFLIGLAGAIPQYIYQYKIKRIFIFIMPIYLYLAYRAYSNPDYGLLPYNFIWE